MNNLRVSIIITLLLTYFILEVEQKLYAHTNPSHYDSDFISQPLLRIIVVEINYIPNGSDEKQIMPFTLMNLSKEPSWKDSLENSNETYEDTRKHTYITEGCSQGYGYKVYDENPICIPLENNETKSSIFCDALGCPYNPPRP